MLFPVGSRRGSQLFPYFSRLLDFFTLERQITWKSIEKIEEISNFPENVAWKEGKYKFSVNNPPFREI